MRTLIRAAIASSALVALAGCATGFPAEVSRYEAMPAPMGESFYIVPAAGQQGGLEFSRFAELVAQEMREEGYTQAPSREEATMIVSLGYDVDKGRERIVRRGFYDPFYRSPYRYGHRGFYDPFYDWRIRRIHPVYAHRYYGSRLGYYHGWDDPFWYSPRRSRLGYGFAGPRIRSFTEYHSELDLDIQRAADGQPIFEGTAQARSRTDDKGTLVPNLIAAMFTDFPGNSGETVKITVKPESD